MQHLNFSKSFLDLPKPSGFYYDLRIEFLSLFSYSSHDPVAVGPVRDGDGKAKGHPEIAEMRSG